MNILVLNCGSSSIKYQLFSLEGRPQMIAKGLIEKIGLPDSRINHKVTENGEITEITSIPDHQTGIDLLLKKLLTGEMAVLASLSEIHAVGHRVAHGGEKFKSSVLITPDVEKGIEECCELAPLHNPANLKGIQAMQKLLPHIPQLAVFDTSFHHTLPDHAYIYGIPVKFHHVVG